MFKMLNLWPVDNVIKNLANTKLFEIEKNLQADFVSLF